MRKLLLLVLPFTLLLSLMGCDPHFDVDVNPIDRKACSVVDKVAYTTPHQYVRCLKQKGYRWGRDPLTNVRILVLWPELQRNSRGNL
jgi:hypothetical protein